jgi:hypothetical protein
MYYSGLTSIYDASGENFCEVDDEGLELPPPENIKMSPLQHYSNAGQDEYPDDDNNSIFDDTPRKKKLGLPFFLLPPSLIGSYESARSTTAQKFSYVVNPAPN